MSDPSIPEQPPKYWTAPGSQPHPDANPTNPPPSGYGQAGSTNPGYMPPGYGQVPSGYPTYPSAQGQSGYGQPQFAQPGYGQPYQNNQMGPGGQSKYGQNNYMTWAQMKPGIVPIRPLQFGDVMGGIFQLLRFNPKATFGLTFIVVLLATLLALPLQLLLTPLLFSTFDDPMMTFSTMTPLTFLLQLIASVILLAPLTIVTIEAVKGNRITVADTWKQIRPNLKNYILTILLTGVILALPMTTLILLLFLSEGMELSGSTFFGLGIGVVLVMLVLSAFLGIRLIFAMPASVNELIGPVSAVKRSWLLTRTAFFRILGYSMVINMVVQMLASAVALPVSMILTIVSLFLASDAAASSVAMTLSMSASAALTLIISQPLLTAFVALMYTDQRIRKEGFDIDLMSNTPSLNTPPVVQ
ncbi:MAG: hypothetical protein Q4P05_06920 [Actinomycetaceae bacterium]|nr:hypothetical protein [Actinomycetaceae bacterium]